MTERGAGAAELWGGRGLGVSWGAGAAKGVGFGPQIRSGATDLWGLGAVLGEIPAAGRGYDGSWGAGVAERWGGCGGEWGRVREWG